MRESKTRLLWSRWDWLQTCALSLLPTKQNDKRLQPATGATGMHSLCTHSPIQCATFTQAWTLQYTKQWTQTNVLPNTTMQNLPWTNDLVTWNKCCGFHVLSSAENTCFDPSGEGYSKKTQHNICEATKTAAVLGSWKAEMLEIRVCAWRRCIMSKSTLKRRQKRKCYCRCAEWRMCLN